MIQQVIIIFLFTFSFCYSTLAQVTLNSNNLSFFQVKQLIELKPIFLQYFDSQKGLKRKSLSSFFKTKTKPFSFLVPSSYNYEHLAYFCKIEVKLEAAAKIPIKFRLGDIEYVDKLEGK